MDCSDGKGIHELYNGDLSTTAVPLLFGIFSDQDLHISIYSSLPRYIATVGAVGVDGESDVI